MLRAGTLDSGFTNQTEIIETVYDFSEDAGATGDLAMTAAAGQAMMVKLLAIKVNTALTSGGSATLTVETSTTADAFLNSEAVASFTVGSVILPDVAGFVKVASGDTLDFSIEVAALTAGKLTFVWELAKF